jgi:hypothetical protein
MAGLAEQIRDRATSWKEWRHNSEAREAYRIASLLNDRFFEGNLPVPVIGFDDSGRLQKEGAYHYEGDDIALSHHIDIRKDLIGPDLGIAILHNLVHMDTEVYGTKSTWYHPKSFRDRMESFGVIVAKNGDAVSVNDGLVRYFAECGLVKPVDVEPIYDETPESVEIFVPKSPVPWTAQVISAVEEYAEPSSHPASHPAPMAEPKAGSSGYFKWVCGCKNGVFGIAEGSTTARAARLKAYCTVCGETFKAV